MIPQAYGYPPETRAATRDLLRRRNHLMRKRAESIAHIQNTVSQYNLPPLEHRIRKRCDREDVLAHFPDVQVRNSSPSGSDHAKSLRDLDLIAMEPSYSGL